MNSCSSPQSKHCAPRNRTLTVTPEEADYLEPQMLHPDDEFKIDSIMCGNIEDCVNKVPDGYFQLIIIDPPYNLSKDFHGTKFSRMKPDAYEQWLNTWFGKVCDKLAPNGTLYMCGDWQCSAAMQSVIARRLTILNRITWQRDKGRGAQANWKNTTEDIWFAVNNPHDYYFNLDAVMLKKRVLAPYRENGKPKGWNETDGHRFRLTHPSNFWNDISIPFWSMPENTDHPTQKPEKLYAKLILASSQPGDRIFDPFSGSGTAAVTAKKLGRHFFGIEINPTYCLWTLKRLQQADSDTSIQGYADGIFYERNTHPATK
ncbi:MAG: site-specific DNA-methyltransferase [Muribaculaceae bacterium]|nr:site-specific DNA-methyltransferase [Muribaculaceae bacterium]